MRNEQYKLVYDFKNSLNSLTIHSLITKTVQHTDYHVMHNIQIDSIATSRIRVKTIIERERKILH